MNPILSILRGVAKSIPLGNIIVEAVENRKAKKELSKTEGEIINGSTKVKMVEGKPEKPHDLLSIIAQAAVVGGFVYLFVTKQITIEKLMELLNYFTT